jgi:RNA polymerase sigma factor (sigma-70 family)
MTPAGGDCAKKTAVPPVSPPDTMETAHAMADSKEGFVANAMAEFESPLVGYAMTILHDLERARDVVQDTFIRLCQQDAAKLGGGLKAWLFTVCRNRALDVLRKEKRVQPLDEVQWKRVAGADMAPDERASHAERLAEVMHYLGRLSENQRQVILLKFQQGLSYKEISDLTGLGSGNVGFLIHTGLKRLRDLLPDHLR